MSRLKTLKELFIAPLSRAVPTIPLGTVDRWDIVEPGPGPLFVVSAGVGRYITFEQALLARWRARMILLDPSPTGQETMERIGGEADIEYRAVGLAAEEGVLRFARPLREEEGSFFMAAEGAADSDMIAFDCTTLNRLLAEAGRTRIDVLKLDIEGAEYAVIDRLLRDGLEVGQLCVEIHTHHHSGAGTGLLDALLLILRLYRAGYRIVYNTAMDFTFVHKSMLP